jgi:tRNA (cmo5U34)-methyltransferase
MANKTQTTDRIFAENMLPGDFVFDEKVAGVFEDMINRSVPGYGTIIAMIGILAERYYQKDSKIYDLGCSLGGATFSVFEHLKDQLEDPSNAQDHAIIAIDNSTAMLERLSAKQQEFDGAANCIEGRCENIQATQIENASVVILNFTLQFIPPEDRAALIKKVFQGMNSGGILIVSEKIVFPDQHLNDLLIELYHQFKENMGYSKLEISQKRSALENVLIPETLDSHRDRILQTGFSSFEVWFQCFNFASMVAIK